MKRWRVAVTCSVAAVILFVFFLVPLPVNRLRGPGVVQAPPEAITKVYVPINPLTRPAVRLEALRVQPGQRVNRGDVLAEFADPDLEEKIEKLRADVVAGQKSLDSLRPLHDQANDLDQKKKFALDIARAEGELSQSRAELDNAERQRRDLTVRADRPGVIGAAPKPEDVGRLFDAEAMAQPFCTIIEPGKVRVCFPVVTSEFNQLKADTTAPSWGWTHTHNELKKHKVALACENEPLESVLKKIEGSVRGLKLELQSDSGIDTKRPITYKADPQSAATALSAVLGQVGLGYVILSEDSDRDGVVVVRPGSERGVPEGGLPARAASITLRIQGRGSEVWRGKLAILPESEAKEVPVNLSTRGGGPIATKAKPSPTGGLVPQTQHYLVYVDVVNPDDSIMPGQLAQVKIYSKPITCAEWCWRKVNDLFDLGLMG